MRRLEPDEVLIAEKLVQEHGDRFKAGHPGHGEIKDFTWYLVDCMAVSEIALGTEEDWSTWMKKEMERAAAEGVPDRYKTFLESDPKGWDPTVIVEGTDSRFYVWVGHHRVGAAVFRAIPMIDALVGLRRPKP